MNSQHQYTIYHLQRGVENDALAHFVVSKSRIMLSNGLLPCNLWLVHVQKLQITMKLNIKSIKSYYRDGPTLRWLSSPGGAVS